MDIFKNDLTIYNVGILLIDGFALMSYSSVVEPLRAANLLADATLYNISHISITSETATSSGGAIIPTDPLSEEARFDLVLVVAGGYPAEFQNPQVFQWLRKRALHGVVLGGVSGGPVILAAAGVMERRRMTVHWEHIEALREFNPNLMLERSLYVIDRDRITCAGGVAPLDMMHILISEHHGPTFARQVSDWFMHTEVRPAGGPQRAGIAERYETTNPQIVLSIEAMENHLAEPLSLQHLARISGIGPRQLNRIFRGKLGLTTMEVYRGLRLDKGHSLLSQSTLSITEIAMATGFTSSAHFSTAFSTKYGLRPSAVRSSSLNPTPSDILAI
jgi:transcriptional regulator GlxA family with amidase domain